MTTTLRPTGPLQQTDDGGKSRSYEIRVNSRPVGTIDLATDPGSGHRAGTVSALRVAEPDRRRGRATVALLAAEEVLRGWGCGEALADVPAGAVPALRLLDSLGYTEHGRHVDKPLPPSPPELPRGVEARPVTAAEYDAWPEGGHRVDLPDGPATPDVSFGVLTHGPESVGRLRLVRREIRPGAWGAYVAEAEVAEARRGQGYGRALMLLAERVALSRGSALIGLYVRVDDAPAVRLCASLGYGTARHHLVKRLL
ncbi:MULTISPECIES: GNAT family N-acetyltransferase [unclassified Streptomyces]|uniref:GNAT family N-acetyltransferase n=1 Tax=unclassified Streptomyces TaxID=2593676 RepID=UPI00381D628F